MLLLLCINRDRFILKVTIKIRKIRVCWRVVIRLRNKLFLNFDTSVIKVYIKMLRKVRIYAKNCNVFCWNTVYLHNQSLYLDTYVKNIFFLCRINTYIYFKFEIRKRRSNQKVVNKVSMQIVNGFFRRIQKLVSWASRFYEM